MGVGGACSWSPQKGREGGGGMRVELKARRNFIKYTIELGAFFIIYLLIR